MMNEIEIGRPLYWDVETHINSVIQMIRADEIQIALEMLEKIPAWYRENPPKELQAIRQTLYRQLYDQLEYAHDDEEASCTKEFGEKQWADGYMFPRAEIIKEIVKTYNDQGKEPWIFDLGCSHGNLPLGLMQEKLKFKYCGKALNGTIEAKVWLWCGAHWARDNIMDQPTILYCTEVLEHCMNPMDIVQSSYKPGTAWDKILLSTPLGCLGGGLKNWDTRRLGHVRGWTKQEFYEFAAKHWPGYSWRLTVAPSMVLLGEK